MRIPDLESLIEDSEKTSPDYVSDEARQKLIDEAVWMDWAEKQLADAQREMNKLPYVPVEKGRPIDLIPATSSMSGMTWRIETSNSSNGRWVDNVPVTLTAPQARTTLIVPKIGFTS